MNKTEFIINHYISERTKLQALRSEWLEIIMLEHQNRYRYHLGTLL